MITKVQGDILLSKAQAIAHGIAPFDHFNQGLALTLRENYPSMAKDFRHYCHQYNPKAGGAWLWAGPEKIIINLMTQEAALDMKSNPGKASIKNVNHALKELRSIIEKEGITSIALPKIATGVGGLSWDDVEPLIEDNLGDLKISIMIYDTYQKGKQAKECFLKAA